MARTQKTYITIQKHVEHQVATDIQKKTIFVFFGFFLFSFIYIYNFLNDLSQVQ